MTVCCTGSYDVTCVFQDDRGCDHMFFAVGSDETEPILVEMEECVCVCVCVCVYLTLDSYQRQLIK